MCPECDTVWLDSTDINNQNGQNFEDFMIQKQQVADWKTVAKIKVADKHSVVEYRNGVAIDSET